MENFNNGFDSFKGGNRSNIENELNPEMTSKILKSPGKNQLPSKNFMNPTISATIKASSVPRKKILGERKETLDTLEQPSLQRSNSFGSKSVKSGKSVKSVKSPVFDSDDDVDVGKPCLEPYDPVKNYLSPRPKFLRYNPNRRRKISNLQESDEDGFKISTYFDEGMPSSDLQLGLGSCVSSLDSCSHQESVKEDENVNVDEDEDASGEDDDEEEMVEFGEEGRCCSVKGFFKFLFAVIAVILTAQAICLVNSPSPSQSLESVYGLNFTEVAYGPIGELDLLVGRVKEVGAYSHSVRLEISETIEESVAVQDAKTDDYVHQDELQNDDSNVIQDEELSQDETVHDSHTDESNSQLGNEVGFETANVIQDEELSQDETVHDPHTDESNSQLGNKVGFETANDMEDGVEEEVDGVEAETVLDFNQDALTEEDDSYDDVGFETANDMVDGVEEEVDDIKTDEELTKFTSFDTTTAVLIGNLLVLTSFCVIYCSKWFKKSPASVTTTTEKEEFEDLVTAAPLENDISEPMIQQKEELVPAPLEKDISEVHIPSVHLLGEFMFGEELTNSSNISAENHSSNSLVIQTTEDSFTQTKSSHMEMSSEDSQTVKKQKRKNAGVVTPSPVRRSSRLKSRSIMTPLSDS